MSQKSQQLRSLFKQVPAQTKSTARALQREDIRTAIRKIAEAKRRVRVYSREGFVPNSYRYTCRIQYVEAVKTGDGWRVYTGWTGAQRSGANGSLVVVQ